MQKLAKMYYIIRGDLLLGGPVDSIGIHNGPRQHGLGSTVLVPSSSA